MPFLRCRRPITHKFNSAHIVKWVIKSNHAVAIVKDCELIELLTAGRPNIVIPSPFTVSRDIKAAFTQCHERIAKLLQVCVCSLSSVVL